MESVRVEIVDRIAEVTLARGKVNALDERTLEELHVRFGELAEAPGVGAVILTGSGKFFSFGFDIPSLLGYPKADFVRYLGKFTGLYRLLWELPKPLVAALNGHTVAGGCMLALACDARLLAAGGGKVSLNEITFGASVFAGATEMLRFAAGDRAAEEVLYTGALFTADDALRLRLVDRVVPAEHLAAEARALATRMAGRDPVAFASIKRLLRRPVLDLMTAHEAHSIREFADIWYSPSTWAQVQKITIR